MAKNEPTTSTEAAPEKRKRKAAEGPRKVKPILVLLGLDEAGAPKIFVATQDAMQLVTAIQANPQAQVQTLTLAK